MKKRLPFIIIAVLSIIIIGYFSFTSGKQGYELKNTTGYFGSEDAPVHLVLMIPSEARYYTREIKRVQDVLVIILSELLQKKQVYLRTVPEPESSQERTRYLEVLNESTNLSILLSPFEGINTKYVRQMAAEIGIPYLFFSLEGESICANNQILPNMWNLGVTTPMYLESYLSTLNQRFLKIGSDVRFFIYLNENNTIAERATRYKNMISELGFEYIGAVSVDERFEDLYNTIRAMFGKDPDVLIGLMTPGGRYNFIPQSFKLGLNLEMGLALDAGIEEEELRIFGKDSEGVIIPVTYVSDFKSEQNEIFKVQLLSLTRDEAPTMASYKGFLLGKLIEMSLSRLDLATIIQDQDRVRHFISALASLDKSRILGPSGNVMIDVQSQGLIQPLHVANFKDGRLQHSANLGDISQSVRGLCESSLE